MSEFYAVPRVIDSHVHLYPDAINRDPAGWAVAHGEPHWAELCTRRRKVGQAVQGFPSAEALLRVMDRAGVERAVLLGWYWERAENCARQNRFFAECVRSWPERFWAFAAVQPARDVPGALAELRRARDEGLSGIGELSPQAQGYAMDGPELAAVLGFAREAGWPVNLHVTDSGGRPYPGRVETPRADFERVTQAWPEVRFILAHWGGGEPLPEFEGGADRANVFYDTAASPLLYGPEIWGRFVAAAGAAQVLFGSDFPLNNYPRVTPEPEMSRLLAEARGAGLAASELAAVLAGNAARLLAR